MPNLSDLPEHEIMQIISVCRAMDETEIRHSYPTFCDEIMSLIRGTLSTQYPSFALVENHENEEKRPPKTIRKLSKNDRSSTQCVRNICEVSPWPNTTVRR